MPPLPVVDNVIKTDFAFTYGSDSNVHSHLFWMTDGTAFTPSELHTFTNAIVTAYNASLSGHMNAAVTLKTVTSLDLSSELTAPIIVTANTVGLVVSPPPTAQTCVLFNLHISRRYKGGHPRLYWPAGAGSDIQNPQSWTAAFTTSFGTAFSAFINSLLNVSGAPPVATSLANVSYHSGHELRPVPVVDVVTSWSMNPVPASQRRRMGR